MKPGIYLISYQPRVDVWQISYVGLVLTDHKLNTVYYQTENLLSEEYSIFIESIHPIAAFTRGGNLIEEEAKEKWL